MSLLGVLNAEAQQTRLCFKSLPYSILTESKSLISSQFLRRTLQNPPCSAIASFSCFLFAYQKKMQELQRTAGIVFRCIKYDIGSANHRRICLWMTAVLIEPKGEPATSTLLRNALSQFPDTSTNFAQTSPVGSRHRGEHPVLTTCRYSSTKPSERVH